MNYLNHIKTTRKTLSSILNNIVQNSLSHGDIAQLNAQIRQFETLSTEIPAQLTEDAKTLSLQIGRAHV